MWIWIAMIAGGMLMLVYSCSGASAARPLGELGTIVVDKGLETRAPVETAAYALFRFERIARGFSNMGSNTPIAEKLVIAAWTASSRESARKQAIELAQDRIEKLDWLDGARAEGVHKVNASETAAWLVLADAPERGLTAAYMVWKKDAPRGGAEKISEQLRKMLNGFRPGVEMAEYLRIAADRPGAERARRMKSVETALAKRGTAVAVGNGPVADADGSLYELYSDAALGGRVLAVLLPLGELPLKAAYQHLRPATPRGIGNWPDVVWFRRDGERTQPKFIDGDVRLSAQMLRSIQISDAGKTRFYAVKLLLIDDLEMPEPDLGWYWEVHPKMVDLFTRGRFVE